MLDGLTKYIDERKQKMLKAGLSEQEMKILLTPLAQMHKNPNLQIQAICAKDKLNEALKRERNKQENKDDENTNNRTS